METPPVKHSPDLPAGFRVPTFHALRAAAIEELDGTSLHRGRFIRWNLRRRDNTFLPLRTKEPPGLSVLAMERRGALFIHIPKTAGLSLAFTLFGSSCAGHGSIHVLRSLFRGEEWRRLPTFTFVRNPWDRLVSAYQYLKTGGRRKDDRDWVERHLNPFPDFRTFVLRDLNRRWVKTTKAIFFYPQHYFYCSRHGRILVDRIYRFEELEAVYPALARALGVDAALQHENARQRPHYTEYYDTETRAKVAEFYQGDIIRLGHCFGGD